MSVLDQFLVNILREIVNPLILLLIAVAFLTFVWGVFKFVKEAGNDTERTKGKLAMFWSIIGFVIMFGAYGIVNIATETFGLDPVERISQ